MPIFSPQQRALAQSVSCLVYCNPFLPERIALERDVLGEAFVGSDEVWNAFNDPHNLRPNLTRLRERTENLAGELRQRLVDGEKPAAGELELYADVVFYVLYYRSHDPLREASLAARQSRKFDLAPVYRFFLEDVAHFFRAASGLKLPETYTTEHLFASFYQVIRAFLEIFDNIVGRSITVARLRAAVWQSIFTHDLRRYQRLLFSRMGDFTTLISGPSGTGKELVARAIALSRYIPFDPRKCAFVEDFTALFHALNLSALSPTLIESELFGHRRGAFTGALQDRAGWLEICKAHGTVFLDEIGELDPLIQVKLLRVLQARTFQRLGDTQDRHFAGKIIAATNRDLSREMSIGRFRKDFYYRLCSDMIVTPSLEQQLRESPDDLRHMVAFIAQRIAGPDSDDLADEVERWIRKHMGMAYSWPGNFRELEQCVRNVLLRQEYRPLAEHANPADELAHAMETTSLTADALLRRYCAIVYARTGSYEETARRLQLDRRTVKAKLT